MKIVTLLRSNAAVWISPFALVLVVLYYRTTSWSTAVDGWAPLVVARAELTTTPLAYALAAGFGVWESGRLTAGEIWQLAPARSRYRIAAEVLAPVVALAWLMHLLVVGAAFAHTGVTPTLNSLRALVISIPLCTAYAVLGFAVGRRFHRYFAAPIFAALVWLATAMAWSIGATWPRHLSGVFPDDPDLGELISWHAIIPHVIAVGGVAAGVALLWLPGPRSARLPVVVAVALVGPVSAYAMVRGWGYTSPMETGRAAVVCVGESPRVCMPKVTSARILKERGDVAAMLADLDRLGVGTRPATVADTLVRGSGEDSVEAGSATSSVMYLPLTDLADDDSIRLAVMMSALTFPCREPAFAPVQAVRMWVARKTGVGEQYNALLTRQFAMSANPNKVMHQINVVVDNALAMSADKQKQWYHDMVRAACAGTP